MTTIKDIILNAGNCRTASRMLETYAKQEPALLAAVRATFPRTRDLVSCKAEKLTAFLATLSQIDLAAFGEFVAKEKQNGPTPKAPPEPTPSIPKMDAEPTPEPAKPAIELTPMEQAIADMIDKLGLAGNLSAEKFDELVAESKALGTTIAELETKMAEIAASHGVTTVEIIPAPELEPIKVGAVHRLFPRLLAYCNARFNSWLTGPAGSFKTSAARKAAQSIIPLEFHVGKPVQYQDEKTGEWQDVLIVGTNQDSVSVASYTFQASHLEPDSEVPAWEIAKTDCRLAFFCDSFSAQSSRAELNGYRSPLDAQYYTTKARIAYEHGAIWCVDEIDAANANTLVGLNALIDVRAGETVGFPDGMVTRNADFCVIATANTVGAGASAEYAGTLVQNGASKDRFLFLNWQYDVELERVIVGQWGTVGTEFFDSVVLPIRAAINSLNSKAICSPRMTFKGAALLAGCPTESRADVQAGFVSSAFDIKIDPSESAKILSMAKVTSCDGWSK